MVRTVTNIVYNSADVPMVPFAAFVVVTNIIGAIGILVMQPVFVRVVSVRQRHRQQPDDYLNNNIVEA